MFVLEESQLLEDIIKDRVVLELYQVLLHNETSNDRAILIDKILSSDQCSTLAGFLLECYNSNDHPVEEPISDDPRISRDQEAEIIAKLSLDASDLAALALVIAATSTQLFVIDNFVGPSNKLTATDAYNSLPGALQEIRHKVNHRSLSRDGSEVQPQVANPWLLRFTHMCWNLLQSLSCSRKLLDLEFLVWKHRYLTVYTIILLEPTEYLMREIRKLQEYIFDHHIINDSRENKTQLNRFDIPELCMELVQSSLLRDGITFCKRFFDYACELTGLSIEHTGVLGRRTKFQQNDIPQLVIKVSNTNGKDSSPSVDDTIEDNPDLPVDVRLDDDTLLPEVQFVDKDDESCNSLRSGQVINTKAQLLLMTNLDIILKSEVMEESLKDEWILAYIRSVVRSATIWTVKFKVLSMRSQIEKKNMRKMDRALRQMEELIKGSDNTSKNVSKRLKSFYSVLPSSIWHTQKALGDMSFDLGLHKNALDVYQRIECYEGIIKCYCALNQTGKAEKIIKQELDKNETPYLYCLLGDVTDNIEHYEKAWTLSKSRFARAKKSIGTYHYVRKEYDEAIVNYEQALTANPSNVSILFLLAYSCLITERYERAAECYRNITYHDDSSFLAWNNLSKAYIKLNQKERAWRTLREAIKCNYEEWKIWENFMLVSIEIGALDDVITAWHRIIDIKSSHKDDQILEILTHSLTKVPDEKADTDYMQLLSDALKLVARLNSTSDCSSRLWICYYKLLIREFQLMKIKSEASGNEMTKLDVDSRVSKIVNALQRATPVTLNTDPNWLKVPEKVEKVMGSFEELSECYKFASEVLGDRPELSRQRKYFELSKSNANKALDHNQAIEG